MAFQKTQQRQLEILLDIADFVQKHGAAVGRFKDAHAVAVGAGEGAAHGAEQFAFQQRGRDGAAIHGYKGLVFAHAEAVDHARHQVLTGTGLAFDNHRGVGGGRLGNGLINLYHSGRDANHLRLRQILFRGLIVGPVAGDFGARDGVQKDVQFEGLGNIVERPAAGSGHHRLNGAAPGHQNHRAQRVPALGGIQHVEAGALVDIDIGDHNRVGFVRQTVDGVARGGNCFHLVPVSFQRGLNGELKRRIVFH